MRTELTEKREADEENHERHHPEVDAEGRPHPEPGTRQHGITVPRHDIVERIQLQQGSNPWCTARKEGFIVHDRAHPDTELEADSDDLLHVLKEDIDRTREVAEAQPQHGRSEAVVDDLEPAEHRGFAGHEEGDQHDHDETEVNEKAGRELDDRKELHREDDLLHEVAVLLQDAGQGVQALTEEEPGHEARDQPDHVARVRHRRCGLETIGSEDERIDGHRRERLEKHPDNAEVGADETLTKIGLCKVQDHPALLGHVL